jgi:hypothetical protein
MITFSAVSARAGTRLIAITPEPMTAMRGPW